MIEVTSGIMAHVMQYYEDAAKDTIKAGRKLEQLMWSGIVTGGNHVVTLVRDLTTGNHYYGFNKRLRDQLRPLAEYIPDQLQRRIPGRRVLERRLLKYLDPMLSEEERRILRRFPSACAEHDAYNQFYASRPGALPKESRAVSVMCYHGEYIAVERCVNCLMYAEAMGDVPTDSIDGLTIPLDGYIPQLAQAIMRTNFKYPFQASRGYAAYTPGRVPGNSGRTSRDYAAYTPGRIPGNSGRTSRDYAAYTPDRVLGNSVRTSRDYAAYRQGFVPGNSVHASRDYAA